MFQHIKRTFSVAIAAILMSGCAATNEAMDEAADLVTGDEGVIIVDNTNTTIGSATIYLVPATGTREMIGTVDPNGEAEFTIEPDDGMTYQLVADVGTEEIASPSFTFTENSALEWDLATNVVMPVSDR